MKKISTHPEIWEGSDNVFADLRLPNPEERLIKATLTSQIASIIKQRKLTQVQTAKLLGLPQPKGLVA